MITGLIVSQDGALVDRLLKSRAETAWTALAVPPRDAIVPPPDVVLLDMELARRTGRSFDTLLAGLRATLPQQYVVAVGTAERPELVLEAMRAGANDFLSRGDPDAAIAARLQGRRNLARPGGEAPPPGITEMIVSGRPNDGESLLAMQIAALRAGRAGPGGRTVLLDLNLPLSECGLGFNLALSYTVVEALQDLPRLDATLLHAALGRDPATGLYILPLAVTTKLIAFPEARALTALVETLRASFGHVVVNLGCLRHSDLLPQLLPLATAVVVATTQSLAAIKCCSELLRAQRPGMAREKLVLAVCDSVERVEPGAAKIARTLDIATAVAVPALTPALLNGLNEGSLPALGQPGSAYARALGRVVAALDGVAGAAPSLATAAPPPRLLHFLRSFRSPA